MGELSLDDLVAGKEPEPDSPVAPSEPTPAPAEAEPAGNGHAEPDLDELLRQYDESTRPAPDSAAPAPETEQVDVDALIAEHDRLELEERYRAAGFFDAHAQGLAQRDQEINQLRQELSQLREDVKRERDVAEFDRLGSDLGSELRADFPHIPESFARAKVYEFAMTDQRLVDAFDNRHNNPGQYKVALKYIRETLRREARHTPDPDATADRFAVIQAVRGASERGDIPEPEVRWGELSDAELNQKTKQWGF